MAIQRGRAASYRARGAILYDCPAVHDRSVPQPSRGQTHIRSGRDSRWSTPGDRRRARQRGIPGAEPPAAELIGLHPIYHCELIAGLDSTRYTLPLTLNETRRSGPVRHISRPHGIYKCTVEDIQKGLLQQLASDAIMFLHTVRCPSRTK